jgi:hypothetical protein
VRIWTDLPDLVRTMLATGSRLGELLAFDDTAFDRHARTPALAGFLATGSSAARSARATNAVFY